MTTRIVTTRSVVGVAGSITIKHASIPGTNARIGPNEPVMIDMTPPPIGEALGEAIAARSPNSEVFRILLRMLRRLANFVTFLLTSFGPLRLDVSLPFSVD